MGSWGSGRKWEGGKGLLSVIKQGGEFEGAGRMTSGLRKRREGESKGE